MGFFDTGFARFKLEILHPQYHYRVTPLPQKGDKSISDPTAKAELTEPWIYASLDLWV